MGTLHLIENKLKLIYIWFRRILGAPKHFPVGFFTKLRFVIRGGFMSDQVALYDLTNKDVDPGDYLSEFDWYRSRWINYPYDAMLNNKVICTEVLKDYVRVPAVFMQKNGARMVSLEAENADGWRSGEDVLALMHERGALYMKPIAKGKGMGVHRLEYLDGVAAIDNKPVGEAEVLKLLDGSDGWFISEGVEQGAFENSLYDKTANTIRFITLRDPESGNIKVFFAVQRIGTSATIPVDNGSRGGLVSCIDLETGELSEARSLHSLQVHEVHPDSGAPIKGARIPNWPQIKEEMLALARRFPFINFTAWDILLTDEGICIIEANTSSGVNIIQLWGPQRRGELGDFYRAHGAIK